jgi:hypothetical protein
VPPPSYGADDADDAARAAAALSVALLALGVRPRDTTSRDRVREFVNDLYTWELRRLRARLLRGDFPKRDYAARVETLRRERFWMLSLPLDQWRWSPASS